MAIKALWAVEHSCGHDQEHYLGHKRPSKRAHFARWLATKDCTDCWRAKRVRAERDSREERTSGRRAAQTNDIHTWESANLMPRLEGSEKAVRWGSQIRHQLLAAAQDRPQKLDVPHHEIDGRLERMARTITSASWWIDLRHAAPDDIAVLVADAVSATTRTNLHRRAS